MSGLIRYAHLVGAVLLMGYALFWVLILRATRAEYESAEAGRLESALGLFRWPPLSLPLSATLAGLGWLFLAFLVATGGVMVLFFPSHPLSLSAALADPQGRLMLFKLSMVIVLAVVHAAFMARPRRRMAGVCGALTVLVVAISSLLGR